MADELQTVAAETPLVPATELAAAPPPPAPWPDNWREAISGGDGKGRRTLDRFADPTALWGAYKELRDRFDSGGLVKLPAGSASQEDRAAFRKALGVPDRPEDYFALIELPDGAILGERDRPIAESFATAVHAAGATPEVVSAALAWYFRLQEEEAVKLDMGDAAARHEAEKKLKATFGPALDRKVNAIMTLFQGAPGGTLMEGDSLFARLMVGRMADGRIIGDDPDMVTFLAGLAEELNPAATIVPSVAATGDALGSEIEAIERRMRQDRAGYFKDDRMQARYRELVEKRDRR